MSRHKLVEAAPIGKPSKQLRILRVGWHDTAALFPEFRQPLIIFLLAVFVGGYIYMTLNNDLSDNDPLKLVDMPYIMLALMLLEASIKAPDEPNLIVFWCIQPLLAVYIVGQARPIFCGCLSIAKKGAAPGRQRWHQRLSGISSWSGSATPVCVSRAS